MCLHGDCLLRCGRRLQITGAAVQSLISVSPSRGCKPRTRISRSGGKVGRRMKIWNLFKWKQLLATCRSSGFFVKCPAFNGFSRCCIQKSDETSRDHVQFAWCLVRETDHSQSALFFDYLNVLHVAYHLLLIDFM